MLKIKSRWMNGCIGLLLAALLAGCAGAGEKVYFDANMDFSAIQTVAVLPFKNLTTDQDAAERVRDAFMGMLLATEAMYVLPAGEVGRGISRGGLSATDAPTSEQIKALSGILNVEAVITGVLREYGEVRSGTTSSNIVSLSLQMIETQTGRVVWSASSTKGGITVMDRLAGGGGKPMNEVTEEVVDDLLDNLFQ